ncbi:MAG: hypothetical protein KJ556_20475, partial [Gammaproteobacteria bacterium]|nr:hypothetical protein [Gammaproteobacteria bacterium]
METSYRQILPTQRHANDEVRVIARRSPFETRSFDYAVIEGKTISEILDLTLPQRSSCTTSHVVVNDCIVPQDNWGVCRPLRGDTVYITSVLQSGGGGGGNVIRTVLIIALIVAVAIFAP